MVILGVDPGLATTGFALLGRKKNFWALLECGVIKTEKVKVSSVRLDEIFKGLSVLMRKWRVTELSLELVFFNSNAKTVLAIGEARGVIKLAAAQLGIPIFEYTPLQVKMALTGYGRAEKKQIGEMVRREFKLRSVPEPDDAADAAAIALCHVYSRALSTKVQKGGSRT